MLLLCGALSSKLKISKNRKIKSDNTIKNLAKLLPFRAKTKFLRSKIFYSPYPFFAFFGLSVAFFRLNVAFFRLSVVNNFLEKTVI
jgi:hypothetical protein